MDELPIPDCTDLTGLAPDDFQKAAVELAQRNVAIGLRTIAPPRNARELQAWFGMFRQMSGLDQQKTLVVGLLPSARALTRRAVTIDMPANPLDGFEV